MNFKELEKDSTILYELPDWIAKIMCEYNKLGFLTHTSQPGREYNSVMYKSEYHRYKESTAENVLCPVIRKQRAYVRGYIQTTNNHHPVNFEIKFGSVHFCDDKPVLTKSMEQWADFEETRNIPDANWSFDFNFPLARFPFTLIYPNIDHTDIVGLDIVDTRWNQNDYIWTKLLEIIRTYKNL